MERETINIDDQIFRFVYIEAMKDAVIQLAYKGDKRWLTESNDVVDFLTGEIKPLVDAVVNGLFTSGDEYDKCFLNTAANVCQYINDKKKNNEFTFGNAQKLINILLKYFYILSYKNDRVKERFKFCHCPMDQRLLKNVWGKRAELKDSNLLGKSYDFLKSWGNEDFEEDENGNIVFPRRYRLFQQAVRYFSEQANISALEYDYREW